MSITKKLAKSFGNYDSQDSAGSRFRAKRIAPLLEMIRAAFAKHGHVKIIDVGGTQQYWNIVPKKFLDEHKVEITIVNLPEETPPQNNGCFVFFAIDGCNLACFGEQSFHIGHSNSVVEHVGDWERMVQFAREIERVSQASFVQTPAYWFPVEPHCMTPFFHWLPRPFRIALVMHFQLGHWKKADNVDEAVRIVESARLLNKPMFQALFADSLIITERFLLLPKSYVAVKYVAVKHT